MVASRWTFLTNHAMVLFEVWRTPDITVREIAEHVQITERAAHRILAALVQEGYVSRKRIGRNNHYYVSPDSRFRHPGIQHLEIGRLLEALGRPLA